MSHQIQLSREAELDLIEAIGWYEFQRKGLGSELELSVEANLNRIVRNPLSYQVRYKKVQVAFIDRFPYGIHYFIEESSINVIAIFHMSRDPQSWGDSK